MPCLALYQPDIPQNVGAAMRLCACLGIELAVIEPCGFPWDERKIRQSAMDYRDCVALNRYESWNTFAEKRARQTRLILMTTQGEMPYTDIVYGETDIILAGRESAGVPADIHAAADQRIVIPMRTGLRSINVINAAAMVLGEVLRQTKGFPS